MSEFFSRVQSKSFHSGIAHHRPHPLRSYLLTQPQHLPSYWTQESIWPTWVDRQDGRPRPLFYFCECCHADLCWSSLWTSIVKLLAPCGNVGGSTSKTGRIVIDVRKFNTAMSKAPLFASVMTSFDGSNQSGVFRVTYHHQHFYYLTQKTRQAVYPSPLNRAWRDRVLKVAANVLTIPCTRQQNQIWRLHKRQLTTPTTLMQTQLNVTRREWSLVQWLQVIILCGEDVGSNPAGKLFTPQKLSIHIPNPSLFPSLRRRRGWVPSEILQTFP